jgi:hypothetical protein
MSAHRPPRRTHAWTGVLASHTKRAALTATVAASLITGGLVFTTSQPDQPDQPVAIASDEHTTTDHLAERLSDVASRGSDREAVAALDLTLPTADPAPVPDVTSAAREQEEAAAAQVQAEAEQAAAEKAAAEKAAADKAAAEKAAADKAAAEKAAADKAAAEKAAAKKAAADKAAEATPTTSETEDASTTSTGGSGSYKDYALSQVGSAAQFSCLENLWGKESGWNPNAQNPSSTAYGIAQFLNSTWAGTGIAKTSDGYRQIDAGLIYIDSRYGTPCGAWAHSQATGWY